MLKFVVSSNNNPLRVIPYKSDSRIARRHYAGTGVFPHASGTPTRTHAHTHTHARPHARGSRRCTGRLPEFVHLMAVEASVGRMAPISGTKRRQRDSSRTPRDSIRIRRMRLQRSSVVTTKAPHACTHTHTPNSQRRTAQKDRPRKPLTSVGS